MKQINLNHYNDLKKKYEDLLKENEKLKAQIVRLESSGQEGHSYEHKNFLSEKKKAEPGTPFKEFFFNTKPVDQYSENHEKINLFTSLFRGRSDVYAKKWFSKKGVKGYSPVCQNEWSRGLCHKPKIKCSNCRNRSYEPIDESIIEGHLRGSAVIGIYPLMEDETCHFMAMDFDKDGWDKDAEIIRKTCADFNIPIAIEVSQSGNGCHVWFFFDEKISSLKARKFGTLILTSSMEKRHEISFESYDRLFPNQDTMPKGGLGNLIALPLQKHARDKGNSVFIDENFTPYPDQWDFLCKMRRISKKDLAVFIEKLGGANELGELQVEKDKSKPWETVSDIFDKSDFPDEVKIIKSGMLFIEKQGLTQKALNRIKRFAAFKNPEFYKAQAMRLPTYGKPRIISCSEDYEDYLALPRGCEDDIKEVLDENHVRLIMEDKLNTGRRINACFNGILRDDQEKAVKALNSYDTGVLSAATAFGKTIAAAKLISMKKVNTLVLVHRRQLLFQWIERLKTFLIIDETLPDQPEKRGRKRDKSVIGEMSGGKNNLSSIVDVAIMQSMYKKEDFGEAVKNYGMIIVDECHHVPAVTFEGILKKSNAKFIYGLTATPIRQDGHHPIIFFYCGPVRYFADSKKEALKRSFEHYLIPKLTSFKVPPPKEDEKELSFQEVKTLLVSDDIRNQLIIDDVLSCYKKGRKSLLLTGRVDHVEKLGNILKEKVSNVFCLTGGMGLKKTAEKIGAVKSVKDSEPFIIVSTGSFIGEGFDEPRLDTLFLAMPVSWKGTLQQYTGRLHRESCNKKDVLVYDYIDLHVKMLDNMYQKRLKAYALIGYKAKENSFSDSPTKIIYNKENFFPVYLKDIANTSKKLIIISPFVTKNRMLQMMACFEELLKHDVKIKIITRPLEGCRSNKRLYMEKVFSEAAQRKIDILFRPNIHQKFAIIDDKLVWYGSINLLSFGKSEESIMRLVSPSIASELINSMEIE